MTCTRMDINRIVKNTNSRVFRNSVLTVSIKVIGLALGYALVFLITKNYGAETMGKHTVFLMVISLIYLFGNFGLDMTILNKYMEFRDNNNLLFNELRKRINSFSFFLSTVLSFIMILFSKKIAVTIFGNSDLAIWIRIASIGSIPYVLLKVNMEGLRGHKKYFEYTVLQFSSIPLVTIVGIVIGGTIFMSDVLLPISFIVGIFLSLVFCIKILNENLFDIFSLKNIFLDKETIEFAYPFLVIGVISFAMTWSDRILIGIWCNSEELGIYSLCLKIAGIISFTLMSANIVLASEIKDAYLRKDLNSMSKKIRNFNCVIFSITFPIFLVIVIFAKDLLSCFGTEFARGRWVLIFLSIGQFIGAAVGSVGLVLQMTGRQNILKNFVTMTAVLGIILNGILIPIYGIYGAAAATMISTAFLNIIAFLYILRNMKINSLFFMKTCL